VLSSDEVRWFWRATDAIGEPFGSIFKLLLISGCRLREVAGLRRGELSAGGSKWSIPSDRTKNKKPHTVPLPTVAQAIIAAVPGDQEIVFSTTGRTPPSGWSRSKARMDAAMLAIAREERGGAKVTIPPWRLHDVRRTFVTSLVELGVPPHVVEVTVNHVSGHRSGVAGVYNRSELWDERREALERWSRHLLDLVRPTSSPPCRAHTTPAASRRT
jgi:integrase